LRDVLYMVNNKSTVFRCSIFSRFSVEFEWYSRTACLYELHARNTRWLSHALVFIFLVST